MITLNGRPMDHRARSRHGLFEQVLGQYLSRVSDDR
jgi:hypothetical protein